MSFEYFNVTEAWQTGDMLGVRIAIGLVPNVSIVRKIGYNPDIDTGTLPEDVWSGGGTYTGFPTQAEKLEVFSSSASDTAAGVGARTISITGLDTNWNEVTETVTLNGVTGVQTVNTFRRFTRALVLTSDGTNSAFNVGDITIRHATTTANVFGILRAGTGATQEGCYTVPAGYTGVLKILHIDVDRSVTSAIAGNLYVRPFNTSPRLQRPFTASSSYPGSDDLVGGFVITEKTDVIPRVASCSANNTPVYVKYEVILFKNS